MRSEQAKAERRADYRRFLKSNIWKAIRGAAIYRAGGQCEWCKGTEYLHVHHKKYPRVFGTETPEMLQVLCDPCHAEQHGKSYIIHKLDKQRRAERKQRIRAMKEAVVQAKIRRKRTPSPETPSLKDRFSGRVPVEGR